MDTITILTVPDPSHKLTQLRPDDPEANSIPDASEVVDIERLAAICLVVSWPPVVLSLHPGVDAHVEGLVKPRAPGAPHCDLVATVLGLALRRRARTLLSSCAFVTFSARHRAFEHLSTPGLHPRPAGLGAGPP